MSLQSFFVRVKADLRHTCFPMFELLRLAHLKRVSCSSPASKFTGDVAISWLGRNALAVDELA